MYGPCTPRHNAYQASQKLTTEICWTAKEKRLRDLQMNNHAEALSKSKTENQPLESDQTRPKTIAGTAGQPKETYPPRERTRRGCSDPNHRLWQCPKLSYAEKMRLDRRKIRPIGDHDQPSCITVRYRRRPIQALVDTGSDVTIAGSNIAKQHPWKIWHAELKSVKTANGEHMLIEGLVTEDFSVGKKRYSVRHLHFPGPR